METKTIKLHNKVSIVTGANQGIGKAIALKLAEEGSKIILVDISNEIIDVRKEIEQLGSEATTVIADVSDFQQVRKMSEYALESYKTIDILVNNAGIYPMATLEKIEENDWDRVLDINLKGTFLMTKTVLPTLIENKKGSIINISSIAGSIIGYENLTHYSASKAGIVGFTKAIALEVAKYNIRVNSIAPGAIKTPPVEAMGEELITQTALSIPLKRLGEPREIANVVAFLASDEASYITGQLLVVDGGLTIQ
jgi:3-oxoacyl-[acyl-carrier protein] reductase